MDVFPASWPMTGRRVALFGAGERARAKLALLRKTPAEIVEFEAGPWPTAEALAGFTLVFVALDDPAEALEVATLARAAGVPVNVVDKPDLSDFHVPAIVDRGDIVISVASGGVSPGLSRLVRATIEAAVPNSIEALGAFAKRFRKTVRDALPDYSARRGAWERILRGPAGEAAKANDFARAEKLAREELKRDRAQGVVHIVGAGPGDPELLTLKALRVLQDADLVVYDRLVDPRILDMARRDAEQLYVGKQRSKHSVPQGEINALLVASARSGKRVVRLKGGDPFVFGRGGEELEALKAEGVEAFVVPGITAALGCAASAGVPLTHRDHAQAVTFVTGHAKTGGAPDVDWAALSHANHTVVIYMGAANSAEIAAKLIEAGRSASTPALIVENGTRPDQKLIATKLSDLGSDAAALKLESPVLLIVGEVAALADAALVAEYWIVSEKAVA